MADTTSESNPPAKGISFVGRLMIAAFMGAVVLAECALAYLWIPSADEVMAKAEQRVQEQAEQEAQEEEGTKDKVDVVEVELGRFSITAHRSASGTTLRVDFALVGTVAESDQEEFKELFDRNQYRFRDLVLVEIRNAEIADLTDPGLGLIKRRILEKSNTLFGKKILRSVFFSDYTFLDE